MVRPLRSQTDARPVAQPEATSLRLFLRDLQPHPPPEPLDPLHVHGPAGISEESRDAPIAIAAILRGERDDVCGERLFVGTPARHLPLGRSVLAEHTTGKPLRDSELLPDMVDASTAAGGAQ